MTTSEAFSRGFDAGNYGNAYTSTDFETAWEVMEDGLEDHPELSGHLEAFRAGYVLGFYSSFENTEIEESMLEESITTRERWSQLAHEIGVAI